MIGQQVAHVAAQHTCCIAHRYFNISLSTTAAALSQHALYPCGCCLYRLAWMPANAVTACQLCRWHWLQSWCCSSPVFALMTRQQSALLQTDRQHWCGEQGILGGCNNLL